MLKILPIQSKSEQAELCSACGIDYRPDALAYAAEVDEKLVGISQFKLTAEGGEIYDFAPVTGSFDFEALFVLGRGTLNFIDLCGVHKAKFLGQCDEKLLRAIGFKESGEDGYTVNLEGFFTDHCHDHNNKT